MANVDHAFALFNGKLSTQDPEIFRTRPSEMVRIFNVALELGAEIYGHTRDLIAEQVAQLGPRLADDARAGSELMKLILDDRDTRSPSLLEQAHDLGLLAAVMPEFAPCTGRVQHDLYHVFTVDQHQRTDTSRRQIKRSGTTQAAQADDQHRRLAQPLLPCDIELMQQDLAVIAQQLRISQHANNLR